MQIGQTPALLIILRSVWVVPASISSVKLDVKLAIRGRRGHAVAALNASLPIAHCLRSLLFLYLTHIDVGSSWRLQRIIWSLGRGPRGWLTTILLFGSRLRVFALWYLDRDITQLIDRFQEFNILVLRLLF